MKNLKKMLVVAVAIGFVGVLTANAATELWYRMDNLTTVLDPTDPNKGTQYITADGVCASAGQVVAGTYYTGTGDIGKDSLTTNVSGASIYDPLTSTTYTNTSALTHCYPKFNQSGASTALPDARGYGVLSIEGFVYLRAVPTGGDRGFTIGSYSDGDQYGNICGGLSLVSRSDGTIDIGAGVGGHQINYSSVNVEEVGVGLNTWHHIAMLYTGDRTSSKKRLQVFLDYEKIADIDATANVPYYGGYYKNSTDGNFSFGSGYSGGLPGDAWDMDVDEIRMTQGTDGVMSSADFLRVPEPATLVMLSLGGIGVLIRRRRV